MFGLPLIRIFATNPREVRPRTLRSPLKQVVVHAHRGPAIVSVTFDLVAQRPDHLAVTVVAALAPIDVASDLLARRVGARAVTLFKRAVDQEQSRYLHNAADRDDDQNADQQ